ncbi:exportin-2 [Anaeramoeba ignava]|uniref:Exportin-2 n=1 Tax=Anaeramoeba ignava TaxID=1746090 RepID=A0A9Q0RB25_ANAIG|nr:exportin-2 [Anaeramoeba ignava]
MQEKNQIFNFLENIFKQTLIPNNQETQKQILIDLDSFQKKSNFVTDLFNFLQQNVSQSIKLASILWLKNILKQHFEQKIQVAQNEIDFIKENILLLVFNSQFRIQKQLVEIIRIISQNEFPINWSSLLSELVLNLNNDDLGKIKIICFILHSILKKYKYYSMNLEFEKEINEVIQSCNSLFQLFNLIVENYSIQPVDDLIQILRLILKIFYSIFFHGIPRNNFKNMEELISSFSKIIINSNFSTDENFIKFQVSLIKFLKIITIRNPTEMENYSSILIEIVFNILLNTDNEQKFDKVFIYGTNFFSILCRKFKIENLKILQEDYQQNLFEKIIVPNINFTENFPINTNEQLDFIRWEIEGCHEDSLTRKGAVIEFVQEYSSLNTSSLNLIISLIDFHFQKYQENPKENWEFKNISINLLLSLWKNLDIDSVENILKEFILPEFENDGFDNFNSVLVLDSLKFIFTFKKNFSFDIFKQVLLVLIKILQFPNYAIQTYTAYVIDKLLFYISRKFSKNFKGEIIEIYYKEMLNNLWNIFEKENELNEIIMKAILTVVLLSKEFIFNYANDLFIQICRVVEMLIKNSQNSQFNYYVFELLSVFNSIVFERKMVSTEFVEKEFQMIDFTFFNNNEQLAEYSIQIASQIMEFFGNENQDHFVKFSNFFSFILQSFHEQIVSKNYSLIPCMNRFISSFITQFSIPYQEIENVFNQLWIIICKCLEISKIQEFGFELLLLISKQFDLMQFNQFIGEIFEKLLNGLNQCKISKYNRLFTIFVLDFIGKYETQKAIELIEYSNKKFSEFFEEIIETNCSQIEDEIDKNECLIGLSRMISEIDPFGSMNLVWSRSFILCIKILDISEDIIFNYESIDENEDENEDEVVFSLLIHAQRIENQEDSNGAEYFVLGTKNLLQNYSDLNLRNILEKLFCEEEMNSIEKALEKI